MTFPLLKPKKTCPCGCDTFGVERQNRGGHVSGCPCRGCAAPFGRPRAPKSLRDTAARINYARLREDRSVFASGLCEATGMHAEGCDGYGTEAHHVWRVQHGGPDSFDNLRWVNANCHRRIHSRPAEARVLGLLEDPPGDAA